MHLGSGGDDSSSIAQIRDEIRTEEIDLITGDVSDNCSVCDRYHICNDHPGAVSIDHSDNRYRNDVDTVIDAVPDAEIIVVTADVERGADS
jgi:hypothetical protein